MAWSIVIVGTASSNGDANNASLARLYYREAAEAKPFGQWQIAFQARAFFQLGAEAFSENRTGGLLEAARYFEDAARVDSNGPAVALRAFAFGLRQLSNFCQISAKSSQIFASKIAFFSIFQNLQDFAKFCFKNPKKKLVLKAGQSQAAEASGETFKTHPLIFSTVLSKSC